MKFGALHLPLAWPLLACLAASSPVLAQQDPELEALRQEVRAMRQDYEARIADLEARLAAAEQSAAAGRAAPAPAATSQAGADYGYEEPPATSPQTVSVARDSSFNPAIGVTFQGQAWAYDKDPEDYFIPGFPLGGEAGSAAFGRQGMIDEQRTTVEQGLERLRLAAESRARWEAAGDTSELRERVTPQIASFVPPLSSLR